MAKIRKVKIKKSNKTPKPKKTYKNKMVKIRTFDNRKGYIDIWVKEED